MLCIYCKHRWEDNKAVNFRETGQEIVDWIHFIWLSTGTSRRLFWTQ